jgi:hypothetical protein
MDGTNPDVTHTYLRSRVLYPFSMLMKRVYQIIEGMSSLKSTPRSERALAWESILEIGRRE